MNTVTTAINPTFTEESRFPVIPVFDRPFRATELTDLELLKASLIRKTIQNDPRPTINTPVRRAANEAAAIAWLTPFPLLVFPELFEEKARTARRQALRQLRIRRDTRHFASLVGGLSLGA